MSNPATVLEQVERWRKQSAELLTQDLNDVEWNAVASALGQIQYMWGVQFKNTYGSRVMAKRGERKWSKAELARRAGLDATTVGLIEDGRFIPYDSQIKKLEAAMAPDAKEQK